MKLLVLKSEMQCATLGTPFPKGVELQFVVVQGLVMVRHPEDPQVTKIVKSQNVTRIAFHGIEMEEIITEQLHGVVQYMGKTILVKTLSGQHENLFIHN